jgi:hypothetical protein
MGDKIGISDTGSLQAGCSRWWNRRSPAHRCPFGGPQRSEWRIGEHPAAYGLERLGVLRWTCRAREPAIVKATPSPSSLRKGRASRLVTSSRPDMPALLIGLSPSLSVPWW